jgi:hypothetical protein
MTRPRLSISTRPRTARLAALALMLLPVLLAACGSSDNSGGGGPGY